MTIKEIQNIIKEFEASTLMNLELETKDVKIKLSKQKNECHERKETIKPETLEEPVNTKQTDKKIVKDYIEVKSPLVGTFYAAENPDAKPFVQEGQKVKKGQVVCIIEAMKIMNEITAPASGVIQSILVHNKDVIGFDQVLMTIGDVSEK